MTHKLFVITDAAFFAFSALSQEATVGQWYTSSWNGGFTGVENN